VFGALMLTGAALADRFGRSRMYTLGLATFVAGSALAALASGAGTLIAARVVQGAGAAMLVPLTLTLISDAFPADKRGAAIGIWGGITGLGVAVGPVVGGAIVQGLSWQWIFWLNVPVGLAVAGLSKLRLAESRGPRPQLDMAGMDPGRRRSLRPRRDSSRARPRQASNRRPHHSRARARSRQAARMTTDTKPAGSGTPTPSPPAS